MDLVDVSTILRTAAREGASEDSPEGVRYIRLSDTLALEMADVVDHLVNALTDATIVSFLAERLQGAALPLPPHHPTPPEETLGRPPCAPDSSRCSSSPHEPFIIDAGGKSEVDPVSRETS